MNPFNLKLVFGFACRCITAYTYRHGDHIKTTVLSHSFPFPIQSIWLSLSSLCHALLLPSSFSHCIPCGTPDIPEPVSTSQSQPRHVCQAGEQVSFTALQADCKPSSRAGKRWIKTSHLDEAWRCRLRALPVWSGIYNLKNSSSTLNIVVFWQHPDIIKDRMWLIQQHLTRAVYLCLTLRRLNFSRLLFFFSDSCRWLVCQTQWYVLVWLLATGRSLVFPLW